jgi:pimeloyl-ACP methyl ester carboxylesterase
VAFDSHGSTVRGWLFLPPAAAARIPAPIVVLGHGLGGTKYCGLGPVATDFVAEGWAALVIDYRGFGDSDTISDPSGGRPQPPGYFHILRVAEDLCAAVGFARTHANVDPAQVVLFGFSMGAHGAAIAALKLQEEAAPVQGVMMLAPRVVPVLPVRGLASALSLDWPRRAMYTVGKIVAGLFCSGVRVTQHMESHSHSCVVMRDSWCSWPIIPDGHYEGGSNTLAVETVLPILFPSSEVRALNRRFNTVSARLLMIFGRDDDALGSDPASLQRLFESKPGEPATVLVGPGEHMSQLPMINPSKYAAHKDTYTRASDTYNPEVYPDHNLPAFQAFLAATMKEL